MWESLTTFPGQEIALPAYPIQLVMFFSSVENRLMVKWPFNTQKSNNNLTKKKDANIDGNKEILNAKGHVNWEQVEP